MRTEHHVFFSAFTCRKPPDFSLLYLHISDTDQVEIQKAVSYGSYGDLLPFKVQLTQFNAVESTILQTGTPVSLTGTETAG